MSVMLQCYSVITDCGTSEHIHGKDVVYCLNAIDKRYIYQLMSNFQLRGSKTLGSHILMHYCTQNNDVSLDK